MTTGYMCYSAPVTLAATGRDRSHVNVVNVNVALKLCLNVAKCWSTSQLAGHPEDSEDTG